MHSKIYIFIVLFSALVFLPFLGSTYLFDWDEVNFAECAREMIQTGDYTQVMINYIPFWEKPPLFIWMQALSMKAFGIGSFSARLPNVFAGICTFLFLFRAGSQMKDRRLGLLWVLTYVGSLLPNIYFHSGIIDPWFNLFIIIGVYYGYNALLKREVRYYLLAGCFVGLAVLTKGPVGLILFAAPTGIFVLLNLKKYTLSLAGVLSFIFSLTIIGGFWFMLLLMQDKGDVITDFISYQIRLFQTKDAGHGGPFYYHILVLLFGCFPASLFAIKNFSFRRQDSFKLLMTLTFVFTLLLFSIVQTKIIHYSSLCYFPITYIAADYLNNKIADNDALKGNLRTILVSLASFSVVLIVLAWLLNHPKFILENFETDAFTKDVLKQEVHPNKLLYLPGSFVLIMSAAVFLLHKMKNTKIAITGGFLTIPFSLLLSFPLVQRIGQYSQAAHIDMCASLEEARVVIHPIGFKSFVPLFYGGQKEAFLDDNQEVYSEWALVHGTFEKEIYFTSKSYKIEEILKLYPQLFVINTYGGFALYGNKKNKK